MGPLGVLLGDPLFGHGTWKGCSLGRWGKGQGSITPGGEGGQGRTLRTPHPWQPWGWEQQPQSCTASGWTVRHKRQLEGPGCRHGHFLLPGLWIGGLSQGLGDGKAGPAPHPTAQPQGPTIKVTHPASLAQPPSCITTSRCSSGLCPITGSADLPQPLRGFLPLTPDPDCLAWEGRVLPHPVYLPAWNQARGQAPAQRWS